VGRGNGKRAGGGGKELVGKGPGWVGARANGLEMTRGQGAGRGAEVEERSKRNEGVGGG